METDPVTDLRAGDCAETLRGGGSVISLFVELAKRLEVSRLEGFSGEINRALRPGPAELKPGLNFVARLGDRGQTGYLVDGEFTGTLPTTRTGSEPKVAILLGPGAFDAGNTAAALGVLGWSLLRCALLALASVICIVHPSDHFAEVQSGR